MSVDMTWASGDRLAVRGSDWRVIRTTAFTDCAALDLSSEGSADTRTLLLPFDRPRPVSSLRPKVVSRRRWAHEVSALVRASHPFGGLHFCPPAIRLLPFQLEPALAILRHGALRLLIADDVGLGKTVEAGLVVREVAKADHLSRTLIVCPSSVRGQWAQELHSLFGLPSVNADAAWLRRATRELPADVNPWSIPGIYLASMDFVKRPEALRPLEDVRWDLLVVDEAHAATPASHRRAAVHALGCRSRRLILLTATPHSGDDDQFEALCSLGVGPHAPPLVIFSRSRSETPLGNPALRSTVLSVRPAETESRTHALLEAYTTRVWAESTRRRDRRGELVATVLRKRALSSPASLALSLRRRLQLLTDDTPAQAQLFLPWGDEEVQEDAAPDSVLAAAGLEDAAEERRLLMALAETAEMAGRDESKVRVLLRLLKRVREPAIVFSEYRDTAERLRGQLVDAGHRVCLLHGGLAPHERASSIGAFNAGGFVLVATDAASEGLNLHHACRLVVHFELPWTPSRIHQRCGRVNRIGQIRRVHEIALVANHTSEQLVLAPLLRRASKASAFSRTSLMSQLTESHVAAHVVAGAPLERSSVTARHWPAVTAMNLADEARAEVARLELLRRVDYDRRPRRARARAAGLPIARSKRRARGRTIDLVASVCLREPGGPTFDCSLVFVRLEGTAIRCDRLREQAAQLLERVEPAVRRVVDRLVEERLATVRPLRASVQEALRRREADMEGELGSTARQLVQAGLFDRRAMRATARRDRSTEALQEDRAARLREVGTTAASTEAKCDVRAMLVGGCA